METPLQEENLAAKRARKRSRYLSPPYTYTYTLTDGDDVVVCGPDSKELLAACTNVVAADMLSALHAAALLDVDATAGVEVLLRFFALHRSSSSSSTRVTAELLNPGTGSSSSSRQKKTCTSPPPQKKKTAAAAASAPTKRLPLTDVRKNLEKMISSLLDRSQPTTANNNGHGATLALAGEMRGLLAKVDKMLAASPAAAAHRPPRH